MKTAYQTTAGSLGEIMTYIPHSTHDDEARFILIITDLIKKGELKATSTWLSSSKDEKAKMVRKKESEKEAKEAEELAKEIGVWDEFYGSGKATDKKSKRKPKGKEPETEADDDHSVLQALILKKKEKNMEGFFDSLAAKYAEPTPKVKSRGKGKKRNHDVEEEEESPKKKSRTAVPPPPEIDDEEFARLQEKLFGAKDKPKAPDAPPSGKKKGKANRVK